MLAPRGPGGWLNAVPVRLSPMAPGPASTLPRRDRLIQRMPELALWSRVEVERLAPDLLSTEAEAKAARQHRDPTD